MVCRVGKRRLVTLSQGVGAPYEAEAVALFARFTTPPTAARKRVINTLIKALKTAGIWGKLDCLYVMAAADAQAARRNWIADVYNLTPVASPVFAADRGYTGDGSSSYLDTSFIPSTAAGRHALNSAHISAWSLTDVIAAGCLMAACVGTSLRTSISSRFSGNNADARVNTGTPLAVSAGAQTSSFGFYVATRTSAAAIKYWPGEFPAVTGSIAASSLASTSMRILGDASGTSGRYWPGQACAASIGAGLTDDEKVALQSALNAYHTAVGAI